MLKQLLISIILLFLFCPALKAEVWKTTAYCACQRCCGANAQGITASGKQVKEGMIAVNWLPFGTKIKIGGKIYVVEDRGAKSLFGSKTNKIKHLDIYKKSHQEALNYGVKMLEVEILK